MTAFIVRFLRKNHPGQLAAAGAIRVELTVLVIVLFCLAVSFLLGLLLLVISLLLSLLRLSPLTVIRRGDTRAEYSERSVGIAPGTLDHEVPVCIPDASFVYRAVVAAAANLIPATIFARPDVSAIGVDVGAAKNDVTDAVGRTCITAV